MANGKFPGSAQILLPAENCGPTDDSKWTLALIFQHDMTLLHMSSVFRQSPKFITKQCA